MARGTKRPAASAREPIALTNIGARPAPAAIPGALTIPGAPVPPVPATLEALNPKTPQPPTPAQRHGPQQPVKQPWGLAHLCALLNLSVPRCDAELHRVCEFAARKIELLRLHQRPEPWPDHHPGGAFQNALRSPFDRRSNPRF